MIGLTRRESHAFALSVAVGAWLCGTLPLFSQEAYYWLFAQHSDLSYFDHPPMVAWLIWLGTATLGDGVLGTRIATLLAAAVTTLAGCALLRRMDVDEGGRILWILLSIAMPAFAATHFLANPDAPLVCFWTLSLLALWRAREGGIGSWCLAGIAAGAALLSKYTAVFLAVGGVVVLVSDTKLRSQLRRPGPWLALAAAGIVFSPVVIWNVQHDLASFRFQTEGRIAKASLGTRWFLQCIGLQFLAIGPVFLLLLPPAIVWLWRRARALDPRALWLLAFGLPLPLVLIAASLWMQVKVNWFIPAYVALLLGGIVWWRESGFPAVHPRWRRAGTWFVTLMFAAAPLSLAVRFVPATEGSSWSGWSEVAEAASRLADDLGGTAARARRVFYVTPDIGDAAQLDRNLRLSGGDSRYGTVLAQNAFGRSGRQFEFWTNPSGHFGDDAVLVLPFAQERPAQLERARRCFASVEHAERVTIERAGIRVFEADLFRCRDYRGPLAPRGS